MFVLFLRLFSATGNKKKCVYLSCLMEKLVRVLTVKSFMLEIDKFFKK